MLAIRYAMLNVKNQSRGNLMRYSFTLNNLNCAHCASKIEEKIKSTNGYKKVNFIFATKQLSLESEKKVTKADIQQICDKIEDGVDVVDNSIKEEKTADNKHTTASFAFTVISVILGFSAFIMHFTAFESLPFGEYMLFVMSLIATILGGYKTFIKGIKSVLKLRLDETTLMSIAVIAAFAIGEFVEGAMVTVLFALGEIIEDRAVNASRRGIEKLANIRPDNATVLEKCKEITVPAADVAIGSTVVVKPYERIPLDGIITKGYTTLDTSALTGESVPVDAGVGSEALSGAINGNSLIEIKTTKRFGDSTAARILRLVEDAAATKGNNEKLITRFAAIYTPVIIAISLAVAILPPLLGAGSFQDWLYRALVCLVASCPCAIVISVPLSYFSGMGAASKIGVLIKGGKYVEALAVADAFVFDKTGTLTTGKLSVSKISSYSDFSADEILTLAAACEKYSSHPVALAIKEKAGDKALPSLENYSEKAGHGISATYKGKAILCGGYNILPEKQKKTADNNAAVYIVLDEKIIGIIDLEDSVRDESVSVISSLKKLGIKDCVMLTGDRKKKAEKVSCALNLDSYKAELLPSDKLNEVNKIKNNHKSVCFVGDGINDAPVLAASDCGFAMGFGSEAAIESADAVLTSGNLRQLPEAVKICRKVVSTVKTNIAFALLVKAAVIVFAIMGFAPMWLSVVADTGVCVLCVLYASRLLNLKK